MSNRPPRATITVPLTPKYIEKDLRGFAMGTAGANEDFKILDW